MSSSATGNRNPPSPPEDSSFEDIPEDLVRMDSEHCNGTRDTDTVTNADGTEMLGCTSLLPNDDRRYRTAEVTSRDGTHPSPVDATVAFWVRVSTSDEGFERDPLEAAFGRLRDDRVIERPVIMTEEHLVHRIAAIGSLGPTRRFDHDRDEDLYTSCADA